MLVSLGWVALMLCLSTTMPPTEQSQERRERHLPRIVSLPIPAGMSRAAHTQPPEPLCRSQFPHVPSHDEDLWPSISLILWISGKSGFGNGVQVRQKGHRRCPHLPPPR